jgi:acetyl esterase/lipase
MNLKKVSLLLLLLTYLCSFSTAYASTKDPRAKMLDVEIKEPSVKLISNVVFSQPSIFGEPNFPLKMDILKPDSKEVLPAVVFIPGGGFMSANKDSSLDQRYHIAGAGYVVASIQYRVTPQSTFPAPLEDVKAAIRYLRANASKYGIDPERIAVMGNSAGGYLASFAGTTNDIEEFNTGDHLDQSSKVQAVIDLYGLSDLTKIGYGFPEEVEALHHSASAPEAMWVNGPAVFGPGGTIFENPEKAEKANPITYITEKTPPFLIMHGDKDTLVSPIQTQILHEALVDKGIDSTYYIVKGAGHGGPQWDQEKVITIIVDFLDQHLKGKKQEDK